MHAEGIILRQVLESESHYITSDSIQKLLLLFFFHVHMIWKQINQFSFSKIGTRARTSLKIYHWFSL